jgi:hypothetical protein
MNTVGGVVWAGVERGASIAEIIAEVVARFRVTEEIARADVARFVDDLDGAGLLERRP